jgi:hypothetical protein
VLVCCFHDDSGKDPRSRSHVSFTLARNLVWPTLIICTLNFHPPLVGIFSVVSDSLKDALGFLEERMFYWGIHRTLDLCALNVIFTVTNSNSCIKLIANYGIVSTTLYVNLTLVVIPCKVFWG